MSVTKRPIAAGIVGALVAATLAVARADAQSPDDARMVFSPNWSRLGPAAAADPHGDGNKWIVLPPVSPPTGPWRSGAPNFSDNAASPYDAQSFQSGAARNAWTPRRSQPPLNNGAFAITTEKSLTLPDVLRPAGCDTDQDCVDPTMPKFKQPRMSVRNSTWNSRKPFMGLSFSKPIN